MELNSGQINIIDVVSTHINEYIKEKYGKSIPRCLFDELSVNKDSICITTVGDGNPVEKIADVTGKWLSGVLRLRLTYRIMSSSIGNDDVKFIGVVDDLYNNVRLNYRSIRGDNFYVDKVSQVSGAKLDAVYSGGVKDFCGIFEINYERREG